MELQKSNIKNMPNPKASLIISVYNNVRFLKKVLDSVNAQTFKNFEVIISEDAMHDGMKTFLENYPLEYSYQHLVQEDLGWRKNLALNRAILTAKSDYLIFIDGDCVLHPQFVEKHIFYSKENRVLAGRRVMLNEKLTNMILDERMSPTDIEKYLLSHIFSLNKEGISFPEEGFFINPKKVWGFIPYLRSVKSITGCNMSFSKKTIMSINGFDEDYKLPAIGEDADITWRFKESGYKLFSVRNYAVQYHLNHKKNWAEQNINLRIMEDKMKKNQIRCLNGIEKIHE